MPPDLVLRELTADDEAAFLQGLTEWEGESPHWYSFIWKPGMTYAEMLAVLRNEAAGLELAPGRVPHTMLYAFLDGKIIGRVSVRHSLNDYLRQRGGHIGYAVAKRFRGRGYATEMVRRSLEFCKGLGLSQLMVTCADDNIPSWKIIERFNGKLEDRVWDEEDKELIRRYWITLGS
jgi:predicted acetyltransferase